MCCPFLYNNFITLNPPIFFLDHADGRLKYNTDSYKNMFLVSFLDALVVLLLRKILVLPDILYHSTTIMTDIVYILFLVNSLA